MRLRFVRGLVMLGLLLAAVPAWARKPPVCVTADEATGLIHKDVCVSAHVYEVVELPDGTRFLDICSPDTPDDRCRFTIVSYWMDREEVGELMRYRDMDVRVRGIVESMHGRAGMILSHVRQFYGGPPRFRPNQRLIRGFDAESERPAIHDPNLRSQGGRRAWMDSKKQEPLPAK